MRAPCQRGWRSRNAMISPMRRSARQPRPQSAHRHATHGGRRPSRPARCRAGSPAAVPPPAPAIRRCTAPASSDLVEAQLARLLAAPADRNRNARPSGAASRRSGAARTSGSAPRPARRASSAPDQRPRERRLAGAEIAAERDDVARAQLECEQLGQPRRRRLHRVRASSATVMHASAGGDLLMSR